MGQPRSCSQIIKSENSLNSWNLPKINNYAAANEESNNVRRYYQILWDKLLNVEQDYKCCLILY